MVAERELLAERWQSAVESQARYYNRKHLPKSYRVGDQVMLSTKNINLRKPSRKLSARYIGPFRIQEPVGTQAYRLQLPSSYRIHPVFHVSYLEPYYPRNPELDSMPGPLDLEDDEGQEQYTVEQLLGKKNQKGTIKYLVKWAGWSLAYNQWVARDDIEESLVTEYENRKREETRR
jgi:hypothetical protein